MGLQVAEFIHDLRWGDLPKSVRAQVRRCLLDTLGAGIGGRSTVLSQIIYEFVSETFGGQGGRLWLDGREVSPVGAALANGMTIDALDIHDGHNLVKGHAGAAVVPAAFAALELDEEGIRGDEFLVSILIGYEIALRAGLSLRMTACDYNTSGAWNALGCAGIIARRLGLDAEKTIHALGIAEYHGPRSQMMRVIDRPTMLKDGSGWGAMVGVSAGLMASRGFTGAPAVTVEGDEVAHIWSDLGKGWLIEAQYFKPYAVCRWAQPAVVAAVELSAKDSISTSEIQKVRVHTFHEAYRLACHPPKSTEEAQYSLRFPVASALLYGKLGPTELSRNALADPTVLYLANRVEVVEEERYNARFPEERIARVVIVTNDGKTFDSGEVQPTWEAYCPPTDAELKEKFRWLARTYLPEGRVVALEEMVWNCAALESLDRFEQLLFAPT